MSHATTDLIGELISNVRKTRFESFDEETVASTKLRIIDVIGCTIGGAKAPGCAMMVDMVRGWGGKGESTVARYRTKAPAHDAAMLNSIMCRSFDFEPVEAYVHGRNIPSHISGTTVPTALAVGEWKRVTGKEFLAALIAGDDLSSRVIAASRFSLGAGWDGTGTVNLFGATAIAGKLLGLDDEQMRNAMGIALNQMAGSFQNIYDGTLSFKLPMALSARGGIFSAELAARGFTSVQDPLTSRHGYSSLYCQGFDPDVLTLNLGKKYFADRTLKPYPACRATHGAIECALQIAGQHEIDVRNIAEVTIRVADMWTRMFVSQPFLVDKFPQARASFSLQYNVANALARKAVRLDHFTEEYIRDEAVLDLARKVKIAAGVPEEKPLGAELEVVMKDGTSFLTRVDVPKGDGTHTPLAAGEVEDKFMQNVAFSKSIPEERAAHVLRMIETLEGQEDMAELMAELS